jgi:drug/metabolite transporter (DMT)-like permease
MQQKHKGLWWILGWCVTFTCGVTTSKFLSGATNNFTLFCVRYICGMMFFIPVLLPKFSQLNKLKAPVWLHIVRALCIGCSSLLTYQTYRNLPLAIATSIGFTGPLLASSFGILLLKEKLTQPKMLALTFGYLGVLFIVQPHYIPFEIYYVFTGLGACILAGSANTLARTLSHKDPALVIMLTTTLMLGTAALFGFFIFSEPINTHDLKFLVMVGAFGSFSQFAYIKAVSYAEVSFVSPFEYTRLLLVVPIGYFLFNEEVNLGQLFGMVLIIAGSLYLSSKSTQ